LHNMGRCHLQDSFSVVILDIQMFPIDWMDGRTCPLVLYEPDRLP
jgi:hypothetical protein